ncbi:hypothetical protein TNCV_2340371 [Trichonephila clavipes]|nr:hypothetical protein TNCV_2340371 [Trichonephila clavipes]
MYETPVPSVEDFIAQISVAVWTIRAITGIFENIDKLVGCVKGTEATRNAIGMRGRKCSSCEVWGKEAEKKNSTPNVLLRFKFQDCPEESSKTSGIPCSITAELAR